MRNALAPNPASTAVIHAFRSERRRIGLRCAHCTSTQVIRWGSFAGRSRYRCKSCGHTFSDLTGTAVAHLKRLDLWWGFCAGVEETETLRAGARRLCVHVSTTFRWRHRLLQSLRRTDGTRLGGRVTIGTSFLKYSEKGSRSAGTIPPPAAAAWTFGVPSVGLVIACADGPAIVAEPVGLRRPGLVDLERTLASRLDHGAVLMSREGRYGIVATLAAGLKRPWRQIGPEGLRYRGGSAAHAYAWRSRRWLVRFRGVASRYLAGYLAWHRCGELSAHSSGGAFRHLILGRYPDPGSAAVQASGSSRHLGRG